MISTVRITSFEIKTQNINNNIVVRIFTKIGPVSLNTTGI